MHFLIIAVMLSALPGEAPGQTQATPQSGPQPPAERRICRSLSEPGRLAGSRRVCMSRANWERMADNARQQGEQMTDGMDSCRLRAEGGSAIDAMTPGSTGQALARMSGC